MIEKLLLRIEREGEEPPLTTLRREFPGVEISWTSTPSAFIPTVSVADWRSAEFPAALDILLAGVSHPPESVLVHGGPARELITTGLEVLTRYQHRCRRRNEHSEGVWFDRLLAAHRALHDLRRPLVVADYLHALDTWHWVLRLQPSASLALQLAALYHDVERLISESDQRVEQNATDYRSFKAAHARAGSSLARSCLRHSGLQAEELQRVEQLIVLHEEPSGDPEVDLLNDADALSFLSLNSPGFLDHYGTAHTRRKLAVTLARLSLRGRERLSRIRFKPRVAQLLTEALLEEARREAPRAEAAWSKR